MLRSCEGLLGKDPRTLGKDLRTFGRDPRTLGRDPRTQLMVRALGLESALAILLSVVLIWVLLTIEVIVTVLLLLVMALVRVEVRLVVGGALALPSPRDPFADNDWGVWGAGGVSGTTARMFVAVGVDLAIPMMACATGKPLLLVVLRADFRWLLGTVRPCSELLRGFVNRGGGMLRRLIVLFLFLVATVW